MLAAAQSLTLPSGQRLGLYCTFSLQSTHLKCLSLGSSSPFLKHTHLAIPCCCALLHSSSVWMPVSTPNKAASGPKPPQTPGGFRRSEICEISTNVALDAKSDLQQICLLTGLTEHFHDWKKKKKLNVLVFVSVKAALLTVLIQKGLLWRKMA